MNARRSLATLGVCLAMLVSPSAVGQDLLWSWTPPSSEVWIPQPVAVDFDGDELPDVVLRGPSTVRVLSFVDQSLIFEIPTGAMSRGLLDVYDFDGDGRSDLVFNENVGGDQQALVVRSGVDGSVLHSFSAGNDAVASGALVSDISGDGRPDMVIQRLRSYPRLQARASEDDAWLWGFTNRAQGGTIQRVGDVNGNGRDEIVASEESGWLAVIDTQRGHTVVGLAGLLWAHPLVQDLDDDSFPDVYDCVGSGPDSYHVIASSRTGERLLETPALDCQNSNESRPLGDLDGDGHHEVLVSDYPQFVILSGHDLETELYRMDDDYTKLYRYGEAGIVAAGDFDGDGFSDFFKLPGTYSTLERVDLLAGDDLWLSSSEFVAESGDLLRLQVGTGAAGRPALLVVSAIDGVPLWLPLLRGVFSSDRLLELEGTVPPGLGGLAVEFLGLGFGDSGSLEVTFPLTVEFE